jgi:hypothetical protein
MLQMVAGLSTAIENLMPLKSVDLIVVVPANLVR